MVIMPSTVGWIMVRSVSGDYSEPRLTIGLCEMLKNLEISFKPLKVFKIFRFCYHVYIYALKKRYYN